MKTQIKRTAVFLTAVIMALVFIISDFAGLNFISKKTKCISRRNHS